MPKSIDFPPKKQKEEAANERQQGKLIEELTRSAETGAPSGMSRQEFIDLMADPAKRTQLQEAGLSYIQVIKGEEKQEEYTTQLGLLIEEGVRREKELRQAERTQEDAEVEARIAKGLGSMVAKDDKSAEGRVGKASEAAIREMEERRAAEGAPGIVGSTDEIRKAMEEGAAERARAAAALEAEQKRQEALAETNKRLEALSQKADKNRRETAAKGTDIWQQHPKAPAATESQPEGVAVEPAAEAAKPAPQAREESPEIADKVAEEARAAYAAAKSRRIVESIGEKVDTFMESNPPGDDAEYKDEGVNAYRKKLGTLTTEFDAYVGRFPTMTQVPKDVLNSFARAKKALESGLTQNAGMNRDERMQALESAGIEADALLAQFAENRRIDKGLVARMRGLTEAEKIPKAQYDIPEPEVFPNSRQAMYREKQAAFDAKQAAARAAAAEPVPAPEAPAELPAVFRTRRGRTIDAVPAVPAGEPAMPEGTPEPVLSEEEQHAKEYAADARGRSASRSAARKEPRTVPEFLKEGYEAPEEPTTTASGEQEPFVHARDAVDTESDWAKSLQNAVANQQPPEMWTGDVPVFNTAAEQAAWYAAHPSETGTAPEAAPITEMPRMSVNREDAADQDRMGELFDKPEGTRAEWMARLRENVGKLASISAEGAKKAGKATMEGAQKAGKATLEGAQAAARATAEGAQAAASATAEGVRRAGKASVEGAQAAGRATREGARAAREGIAAMSEKGARLTEYAARRIAEQDSQAKESKMERLFEKLGDRYNKMPLWKKVVLGTGMALGMGISAPLMTPLSTGMAIAFGGGLVAQRFAGMAGMYRIFENKLTAAKGPDASGWFAKSHVGQWLSGGQERDRKNVAMAGALVYSFVMAAAVGTIARAVADYNPIERLSAWINEQAGGIEVTKGAGSGATEAVPTPGASLENLSVQVDKGKGYEWMAKRLWEQLHDPARGFKLPAGMDPNSDLARLYAADQASVNNVIHDIAKERGFSNLDGTSAKILLGDRMMIGEGGTLNIQSQGTEYFTAPPSGPVLPADAPPADVLPGAEVPMSIADEQAAESRMDVVAETQKLQAAEDAKDALSAEERWLEENARAQQMADAGPALGGEERWLEEQRQAQESQINKPLSPLQEALRREELRPALGAEEQWMNETRDAVLPVDNSSFLQTERGEVVGTESGGKVAVESIPQPGMNAFGIEVPDKVPGIYADEGSKHFLAYGGTNGERAAMMLKHLTENPTVKVIYGADANGANRIPYYLGPDGKLTAGEPVQTNGLFGFFRGFMDAPGRDEFTARIK